MNGCSGGRFVAPSEGAYAFSPKWVVCAGTRDVFKCIRWVLEALSFLMSTADKRWS